MSSNAIGLVRKIACCEKLQKNVRSTVTMELRNEGRSKKPGSVRKDNPRSENPYYYMARVPANCEISQEGVERLLAALSANGISGYNAFWLGCVQAFIAQTQNGDLIAWPPEFLIQERSNEQYIKFRWERAEARTQAGKAPNGGKNKPKNEKGGK